MNTKYELQVTGEFKQNLKLCKKRGLPMDDLWAVVEKLLNGEKLEEKYHPHTLSGNRKGSGNVTYALTGCWFGSKMIKN